jgi:5-methylcytosine-specific restriction endonuclease McrA
MKCYVRNCLAQAEGRRIFAVWCREHDENGSDAKRFQDRILSYKEERNRRGTENERGYDYKRQQYRARYLQKHPLCLHCEQRKRITAATVVDHIVPVQDSSDVRFYDPTNRQPLCTEHHAIKTAEDRAKGLTSQMAAWPHGGLQTMQGNRTMSTLLRRFLQNAMSSGSPFIRTINSSSVLGPGCGFTFSTVPTAQSNRGRRKERIFTASPTVNRGGSVRFILKAYFLQWRLHYRT